MLRQLSISDLDSPCVRRAKEGFNCEAKRLNDLHASGLISLRDYSIRMNNLSVETRALLGRCGAPVLMSTPNRVRNIRNGVYIVTNANGSRSRYTIIDGRIRSVTNY